ncbi:MAG: nicotinamide-nucleotide amidohydrolase family protein [Bacteroidota bacterium]|nr:nicotinamide-nucleotide amidohydrolase family protein [Bacteroidota bacterium]
MQRNSTKLVKLLTEKKLTLALAESMTCGLAAHQLSAVFGTSEVFLGSIVCYTPEMKCQTLGVSPSLIKKHTAESPEVTDLLAISLKKQINASIYAAITGLASRGGSESKNKPVGTVFFSVYYKKKMYRETLLFIGGPLQVRKKACKELYAFIGSVVAKNA